MQSLILGLIQGLTEFLPVSSSGHLALTQHLMGLEADSSAMLLFDVVTHIATLAAVAVVFVHSFRSYLARLIRESSSSFSGRRFAWPMAGYGVLASIPTALMGFLLKDVFKSAFGEPWIIALALVVTGGLLWASGHIRRPRLGWRRFPWWGAIIVGIAQGVAICPGISRSGATICTALFVGLRRRWAGEFSFFIAVPAILGAGLLEIKEALELTAGKSAAIGLGPLVLGAIVAFVSGVAALKVLLRTVRTGKLHFFCYYCWMLALVVLVFGQ
ncbi:MAG: undecaprenyl-diphosphate phosphatase [Phycisphaerae bacterium]|nr:undecaprenyl-diphosphate phosphatase [Phycisphaerae bacterium]